MALKIIQSIRQLVDCLERWILELQEYDFEMHYKKGWLQVVAVNLSRIVNIDHEEIAEFKEVRDP